MSMLYCSYDYVMCQRIMVAYWVTQKLVCTIQEELILSQGPSLNSKRQQTSETAQGEKLDLRCWLWKWKEPWTKDYEQLPEAENGKKKKKKNGFLNQA